MSRLTLGGEGGSSGSGSLLIMTLVSTILPLLLTLLILEHGDEESIAFLLQCLEGLEEPCSGDPSFCSLGS